MKRGEESSEGDRRLLGLDVNVGLLVMEEKDPFSCALPLHTILSVGVVKARWCSAFGFWVRKPLAAALFCSSRPLWHHPSPYPRERPFLSGQVRSQ